MPSSSIAVGINKSLHNQNDDAVHVNAEKKLLNHRKRRRS
jgi:hypothetical protein